MSDVEWLDDDEDRVKLLVEFIKDTVLGLMPAQIC